MKCSLRVTSSKSFMRKRNGCIFLCAYVILCGYTCSIIVKSLYNFVDDYNKHIDAILVKVDIGKVQYTDQPYIVIPNLITASEGKKASRKYEIIICTQTSINNLHYIINLSKMWDGHISVAVFSFGDEISQTMYYILLLQKCFKDIQLKTSFHLVYPTSMPPTAVNSIHKMNFSCNNLPLLRKKHVSENYALTNCPYPINILRNVALMHSNSAFVLNIDIDIVPSTGMKEDMETFLEKANRDRKQAYVIPCFESYTQLYASLSKNELLSAVKNGSMRQYSVKVCPDCHRATNYSKWMSLPYPSEMNSSYNVGFKMNYEPFYITARDTMPMFYENFKEFGRNRISQVCEAYYSGYEFTVMNNAFVIHLGLKKRLTPYKKEQMQRNIHIYRTSFLSGLRTKYPQSKRSC